MAFLYGFCLFLSALLLFWAEPMVGKMLLPAVGGAPAMWNTLMLFFQATLLAGYLYAHLLTGRLGARKSVAVHLPVLLLPFMVLPIAFAPGAAMSANASPVPWLLKQLLLCVGLPFFAVSASAPLLQRWFSNTAHPLARDPYFLYGASNFGSLLALAGYPLLLEPAFAVAEQSRIWRTIYIILILVVLLCAAALRRPANEAASRVEPAVAPGGARRERILWIFYAFVPSSLMLGVTTYITTDLAAVPLLWAIPLAVYLLTFILTFARKPLLSQKLIGRLLPYVFIPMAPLLFIDLELKYLTIPYHLLVFFFAGLLCHGALAAGRPPARRLTEFYLCMAFGGALGGLFNAIIAPLVFRSVTEYPLAMALACLALPRAGGEKGRRMFLWRDLAVPAVLAAAGAGLVAILNAFGLKEGRLAFWLLVVPLAVLWFSFKSRPIAFALGFGVIAMVLAVNVRMHSGRVLAVERNFFGVKTVTASYGFHSLLHGNTTHGIQNAAPERRLEPLSYYHPSGPLGDIFLARGSNGFGRVAAVGLGIGTMAAYAQPGQRYTFFEIDPEMVGIATDQRLFTYLADCKGRWDIVLGDGRLKLSEVPDRTFDLIVLDVFNSDAIPAHFLTREAVELYLKKINAGGLVAFHISNRYLDLEPLLAALAREENLVARGCWEGDLTDDEDAMGKLPSRCVVMARRLEDLGALARKSTWYAVVGTSGAPVWTDQYSNIVSVMRFK